MSVQAPLPDAIPSQPRPSFTTACPRAFHSSSRRGVAFNFGSRRLPPRIVPLSLLRTRVGANLKPDRRDPPPRSPGCPFPLIYTRGGSKTSEALGQRQRMDGRGGRAAGSGGNATRASRLQRRSLALAFHMRDRCKSGTPRKAPEREGRQAGTGVRVRGDSPIIAQRRSRIALPSKPEQIFHRQTGEKRGGGGLANLATAGGGSSGNPSEFPALSGENPGKNQLLFSGDAYQPPSTFP